MLEGEDRLMPLDPSGLQSALQAIFESMPETAAACAAAMAAAYADYAELASFGGCLPVVTDAHRAALETVLYAAIAVPELGLPNKMSMAWATGVDAFWTLMPVATIGAAGETDGCPGKSSLEGSLTGVFANVANTAATCAAGCASALHAATLTVMAHVTPPGEDFPAV